MKVTKSYIKQLVKEELNRVLSEGSLEDDIGMSAKDFSKRDAAKDAGFGSEGSVIESMRGITSRVLFRRTGAGGDNKAGTPHLILHVIEAEGAEELKGAYYWVDYHKKYEDPEAASYKATQELKGIASDLTPKKLRSMIGVGGAFKKVTNMSGL